MAATLVHRDPPVLVLDADAWSRIGGLLALIAESVANRRDRLRDGEAYQVGRTHLVGRQSDHLAETDRRARFQSSTLRFPHETSTGVSRSASKVRARRALSRPFPV